MKLGVEVLEAIGEDPTRPELVHTPRRWADWWREFIEYEPGNTDTTFESITTNQMVTVSGIRVWSLCEHHLLPFWSEVSIGYIATDRILGLSKFGRIAHKHSHKLQVQERLTDEIAREVQSLVGENIAVMARGEHLCMTMRGIRTPARMTSTVMKGIFLLSQPARDEFLALAKCD